MTDKHSLVKLINTLDNFIEELEHLPVLSIHQKIDQSYYMQKVAELRVLHGRLLELEEKEKTVHALAKRITPSIVENWTRDHRWLHEHRLEKIDQSPTQDRSMY